MKIAERFHLTYCSNIHPGESWAEVFANLRTYLPEVRGRLHVDGPFGVGLRLSGRAARELDDPDLLEQFRAFLTDGSYYVFTINGFPYGVFHGESVKAGVYLPDWRDPERLDYSNRLARILAALIPEGLDLPGSVSTVPGAFRKEIRGTGDERRIGLNMLQHVAFLKSLEAETSRRIVLAIEAEPACMIETIDDMIRFHREVLRNTEVLLEASAAAGTTIDADDVERYLGFCFDACHMAVEFEPPGEALLRLEQAGVPVFKFQISSAIRLQIGHEDPVAALGPFAEDVYLHQVVNRRPDGTLARFDDLPAAFDTLAGTRSSDGPETGRDASEWRVHFHVPIFLERMQDTGTTQSYLDELLGLLRERTPSGCLEVETYTWDVLPDRYRDVDVATAIARELAWVRERIEP